MKKTIISVMLLVGLIISPTSAFAAQIYSADAILTPSAGNLMGGLGCFVGGEVPGQYDWTVGNCVPGGTPTDDMVFSTQDTTGWQERMRITKEGNVGIGTTNPGANLHVSGDLKVTGSIHSPGAIVQTAVATSNITSSLNTTVFTEASIAYRVSITPKYSNSIFLIEYDFPINTAMRANTVFHMQLVRNIGGTETPVGVGPVNGSRQRVTYTSRPSNGYDSNDQQNVHLVAMDSGLTAGTTYTYGFKYRREEGGSGTTYFLYSWSDSAVYGFSGVMTMKITEIAQ